MDDVELASSDVCNVVVVVLGVLMLGSKDVVMGLVVEGSMVDVSKILIHKSTFVKTRLSYQY